MTDFLSLAESRYSVRSFTDRKVEPEKLEKILQAGRVAPTAVNNQPQVIYVLQSPEALARMGQATKYLFGAPQALLVCYDENICWKNRHHEDAGRPSGEVDASIVLTHMMLQAWELGIGSCWVGVFEFDQVRQLFDLPASIHPVALMPIGYAAQDGVASARHSQRKPLEETVRYL
ncbi:MAG: nitroreductase family protein [Bacteroidaceae bacterium]|nr:nitroreductase family protein [Bacteroidaceae bacterium]